jgi:hypothetical protein
MQYSVGKVLYVILSKKGQVYPMRIIEEITKKTLRGEEVNYVVQAGSDVNTTILLSQIEGEIFETPDEARRVLVARATDQIDRLVSVAVAKANDWYALQADEQEVHELPEEIPEKERETGFVTLPDGTVARIKMANVS